MSNWKQIIQIVITILTAQTNSLGVSVCIGMIQERATKDKQMLRCAMHNEKNEPTNRQNNKPTERPLRMAYL